MFLINIKVISTYIASNYLPSAAGSLLSNGKKEHSGLLHVLISETIKRTNIKSELPLKLSNSKWITHVLNST